MSATALVRARTAIERRSSWHLHVLVVAFSALALMVAALISTSTDDAPPMTVPLLAVIVSAYLGGLCAGLLSTASIAAATTSLAASAGVEHRVDTAHWLAAIAAGIMVSVVSEALLRRSRRDELARQQAEAAFHAELVAGARRASAAQQQSELRFTRAFHAAAAPLCITHIESGRYIEANEAYLRMCGCTRDELIGATSRGLGLLDRGVREAIVAHTRTRGGVRARPVTIHARNGVDRTLLANTEEIGLDGEAHLLVSGIDVTDEIRAEAAAREGDARFRQLAAAIREVFYLYDRERDRMLYVSPAYPAIWGRPVDALYASPADWIESVHADDRDRVRARYLDPPPHPHDNSYRIVRADGTVRWIEDHIFPVLDGQGRIVQVAGVADDVTERRHLEAQLRQTQKMESVGALAGGVAHDFNNVLTVILTCAEMLRMDADGLARELVDDILSAVTKASALTRQLLVFSRREIVEPRILDLNAAVVDTQKMLRRLIGDDVVLATALAPVLGRVKIDPSYLVQAIMNLVVNARDAMPCGGHLTITTRDLGPDQRVAGLPPGRHALLAVTDTGCGMTAEVQARVFEPFFTTKAADKGTGMGLAVTHGIVQQAGGVVEVRSEVGVGTTFSIYLPCADDDADEASGSRPATMPRGSETVLLVDDADDVRRSAARALKAQGYEVLQASRGADGLALLLSHPGVKILITDVVMPAMDGRELAEACACVAPGLPVVFTSGYTDDAVLHHGVKRNEVAFLQKPFSSDALVRKVREVLDRVSA